MFHVAGRQIIVLEATRSIIASQSDPAAMSHNIPLLLPSAASGFLPIPSNMLEHEWNLRHAQAHEALSDLRGHLEVRSHLYKTKDRFVGGQRANTRARDVISTLEAKINMDAERYRVAYHAMYVLSAPLAKADWQGGLCLLTNADIRHATETEGAESEGRGKISWIWYAGTPASSAGEIRAWQDNLQECKSYDVVPCDVVLTTSFPNSAARGVVQGARARSPVGRGSRTFAGGDASCHSIPRLGRPSMGGESGPRHLRGA